MMTTKTEHPSTKPRNKKMTFAFYLDAWCYTQLHRIKKFTITKTAFREMTLSFTR
jgi:hypothetical protein